MVSGTVAMRPSSAKTASARVAEYAPSRAAPASASELRADNLLAAAAGWSPCGSAETKCLYSAAQAGSAID